MSIDHVKPRPKHANSVILMSRQDAKMHFVNGSQPRSDSLAFGQEISAGSARKVPCEFRRGGHSAILRYRCIHRASSGKHDDLAPGVVVFHKAMSFDDFVQLKGLAYLNVQRACFNLLRQLLKRSPHKVL